MTFIQKANLNLICKLKSDIFEDINIQVLIVFNSKLEKILLLNVYNEKLNQNIQIPVQYGPGFFLDEF